MSLPKDPAAIPAWRAKIRAAAKARAEREREALLQRASKGGAATAAAKTAQQHRAAMLNAAAARELNAAEKRARGDSVDTLSPEKRAEISRKGGLATAAGRTEEERARAVEILDGGRLEGLRVAHGRARALGSHLDRPIKLPSSGRRTDPLRFLKILRAVSRGSGMGGWNFRGVIAKPGALVRRRDLWPTEDFPVTPIVLECAGALGGMRGAKTWVLWRLDGGRWTELAKCDSTTAEWAEHLGPIAASAISPAPEAVALLNSFSIDVSAQARWLDEVLARRLSAIEERRARVAVMALFHDLLSARLAAEMADVPEVVISES
jgi:general stress protein YciG